MKYETFILSRFELSNKLNQMNLPSEIITEMLLFADDRMERYEREIHERMKKTLTYSGPQSVDKNSTGEVVYEPDGWVSFDD